jgi:hypothetical protein
MRPWRTPGTLPGDDEDEYEYDDLYDDWDDEKYRPTWMHPDCESACLALEMGTCCKYPATEMVRQFDDLAGRIGHAVRWTENGADPAEGIAELTQLTGPVSAALATLTARIPALRKPEVLQLICPVGRIDGAFDDACEYSDDLTDAERTRLAPVREALATCLEALRQAFIRIGPVQRD